MNLPQVQFTCPKSSYLTIYSLSGDPTPSSCNRLRFILIQVPSLLHLLMQTTPIPRATLPAAVHAYTLCITDTHGKKSMKPPHQNVEDSPASSNLVFIHTSSIQVWSTSTNHIPRQPVFISASFNYLYMTSAPTKFQENPSPSSKATAPREGSHCRYSLIMFDIERIWIVNMKTRLLWTS